MKQKNVFYINGNIYMSAKQAAELWGLKQEKTVNNYCEKGLIEDATHDSTGKWCIPINTIKPLKDNDIRKILWLIILLKNDPELEIDDSQYIGVDNFAEVIYTYLHRLGYIKSIESDIDKKKILYNAVLTSKGFDVIFHNNKREENSNNITIMEMAISILGTISTALSASLTLAATI